MADRGYTYARSHRALEIAGISLFLIFGTGVMWRVMGLLDSWAAWLTLVPAIISGYVLADFISGTVHWLADRFGTVETPVFGTNFIHPFREHHVHPKLITTHDFIETNGCNCIVSFWVHIVVFFWFPAAPGELGALYLMATLGFSMFAIMATNQIHKWAHMDDPPPVVRALQRLHLILPPDHHDVHHTAPFDTYFCITTGWLNWPLQKLRFYEVSEWLALRLLGMRAGADDAVNTAAIAEPSSRS